VESKNKKGFTLVETIIVVAVIGLLASVAIPSFVKAREMAEKNMCIANLKQIQNAVQIWAIDTSAASTDTATSTADLENYIKKWPTCKTVAYAIPAVDTDPVCPNSLGGHNL